MKLSSNSPSDGVLILSDVPNRVPARRTSLAACTGSSASVYAQLYEYVPGPDVRASTYVMTGERLIAISDDMCQLLDDSRGDLVFDSVARA